MSDARPMADGILAAPRRPGWRRQPVSFLAWNAAIGLGALVRYYPVEGQSAYRQTRTRSEAWFLRSGDSVVLVEGHAGGVHLSHLQVLWPDSPRPAVARCSRGSPRARCPRRSMSCESDSRPRGEELI